MTSQTAIKNHFEMIFERTSVCPCEMEATFKAFFNVDGTEFDSDGFLNILTIKTDSKDDEVWERASDEQLDSFIAYYDKILSNQSTEKIV